MGKKIGVMRRCAITLAGTVVFATSAGIAAAMQAASATTGGPADNPVTLQWCNTGIDPTWVHFYQVDNNTLCFGYNGYPFYFASGTPTIKGYCAGNNYGTFMFDHGPGTELFPYKFKAGDSNYFNPRIDLREVAITTWIGNTTCPAT